MITHPDITSTVSKATLTSNWPSVLFHSPRNERDGQFEVRYHVIHSLDSFSASFRVASDPPDPLLPLELLALPLLPLTTMAPPALPLPFCPQGPSMFCGQSQMFKVALNINPRGQIFRNGVRPEHWINLGAAMWVWESE